MPSFKVFEVSVDVTTDGTIEISQELENDNSHAIILSPDQVDLLIDHLKKAADYLRNKRMV